MWINLEDTEASVVSKLTECLYLGQTTATSIEQKQLNKLIKSLGLKVNLEPDKSSSESSSSDEDEVEAPAKKVSRAKPAGPKSRNDSALKVRNESALKAKAAEDKARVQLERVENSSDSEVKKYYKKSTAGTSDTPTKLAPNPFHKASGSVSSSTKTQKRRLTDSDKKVVAKSSKKARQEDDSSSDDGSDHEAAKAKRSLEIPSSAKAKSAEPAKDSISESDNSGEPSPARASPKRKPGPKGRVKPKPASKQEEETVKPKLRKPEANLGSIYTEGPDQISCCDFCEKIFVTRSAYESHMANDHGDKKSDSSPERRNDSSNDDEENLKENGTRNKKSAAKIREERKKSKRSSDSDSDTEKKPVSKVSKPGPKSKSVTKLSGPKSASKVSGPKSGPASKVRRDSIEEKSRKLSSNSSDTSDEDKPSNSAPTPSRKKKTPAIKLNISSSSKKKAPSTSASSGPASKVRRNSIEEKSQKLSSNSSDSSDEDKPSSSAPTPSGKKKTPKIKVDLSSSSKKKAPSTPASSGPYKCRFCEAGYDSSSNLKNHVLNHFKDEILQELPSCLPFLCPSCKKPSRDKITLLRHYAFSHKAVFKFCPESDFKGRPPGDSPKSLPGKSAAVSSSTPTPASKVNAALKKFRQSAEKLLSSSDSDSDVPKKKPVKDEDIPEPESNKALDESDSPKIKNPMFSSDDEDFECAKKTTDGAVLKTFDDLLKDSNEASEPNGKADDSE